MNSLQSQNTPFPCMSPKTVPDRQQQGKVILSGSLKGIDICDRHGSDESILLKWKADQ